MQVEGLTNDEVKSHLQVSIFSHYFSTLLSCFVFNDLRGNLWFVQKYRLHVRRHPASSIDQGNGLWMVEDQCGDKSNVNLSQSGSPQGPLLLGGSGKGLSSSGDGEEDEKSDCQSWKGGDVLS